MKTKGFSIGIILLVLLACTTCTKYEVDINSTPQVDGDYFVATQGSDAGDGSFTDPWASWHYAFNQLTAGDTLYIRGGVYYVTDENYYDPTDGVFVDDIDGTVTNRICVFNYPGEKPILDGSLIDEAVSTNGVQIARSEYWHIKGLTIRNFPQVSGSQEGGIGGHHVKDIIFENIISYQNGGPGIWLDGGGGIEMTGNKFINCDSYDNYDPYSATDGGDADGFSIAGMQNLTDSVILIGCRSWGNSDDGYDGWETEGIIVFQDCWSFNNGYQADGDGNGFKLGKTNSTASSTYIRQVYNCIAFGNKKHGLTENGTVGLNKVYNFTSYGNDGYGIIWDGADEASVYRNIISYDNYGEYVAVHEVIERILDHNSYDDSFFPDGPAVTDADFVSLDSRQLYRDRKPDGSLPDIDFLNLNPQSKLVDAGIDVGLDYHGIRPDIGAIESFGR